MSMTSRLVWSTILLIVDSSFSTDGIDSDFCTNESPISLVPELKMHHTLKSSSSKLVLWRQQQQHNKEAAFTGIGNSLKSFLLFNSINKLDLTSKSELYQCSFNINAN
ncbi:hypothetical protein T4E_2752 [Trichinella pseudospiralis]|uniref:Ig-like domain-containing protein n=1 Tax=Trichinella pseudospiralis TaxID=6337 RepID=A0A0V0XX89_TRIPS|nr:hypothetical protein T4E_2752 [Trichinella pseudospiralis]